METMAESQEELEVKFYVAEFESINARLQNSQALRIQPRNHEYNLLFDNEAGDITRQSQILRLRVDSKVRLTFKDRGCEADEALLRPELELIVSSFKDSQAFLEALGYRVVWVYEKYRTMYDLDGVSVTLDEMPFGNFVEVEGTTSDHMKEVSKKMDLDWDARILSSYRDLFQEVQKHIQTEILNLTFNDFAGLSIPPEHLGIAKQ